MQSPSSARLTSKHFPRQRSNRAPSDRPLGLQTQGRVQRWVRGKHARRKKRRFGGGVRERNVLGVAKVESRIKQTNKWANSKKKKQHILKYLWWWSGSLWHHHGNIWKLMKPEDKVSGSSVKLWFFLHFMLTLMHQHKISALNFFQCFLYKSEA